MFRNVITNVRRRSPHTLLAHPLQTSIMVAGSLVEQLTAWIFFFRFAVGTSRSTSRFTASVNLSRTATLLGFPATIHPLLYVNRRIIETIAFPLVRKPTCDLRPALLRASRYSGNSSCDLYLRIDDVFLTDKHSVKQFCELFKRCQLPFLAAVTGSDLLNPLNRTSIIQLQNAGGIIGIHGFSHCGKFGPFPSELLQMRYPEILAKTDALCNGFPFTKNTPLLLVPPFNAIGPGQLMYLSQRFHVICGGPETLRFTDRSAGPVALNGGGWYFPSLHPFYGSSNDILRSNALKSLQTIKVPVCLTLHYPKEASDAFASLTRLLDSLPGSTQPWHRLF
jgi:hypothetical protein